jgi:mannan endo-1,4-beta-mannosidase
MMRAAIGATTDQRPVFDSEHGPIHAFLNRHRMLPEAFDDEYFRHIQWAHLASGGAAAACAGPTAIRTF